MSIRSRLALVAAVVAATGTVAGVQLTDRTQPQGTVTASAPPAVPVRFRTALTDAVSPAGGDLVSWSTRWRLSWDPVPGAVEYVVYAVGPEGKTSSEFRRIRDTSVTLTVAAGTTTEQSRPAARDAQASYRATQLGLTVVAVAGDGVVSGSSPVIPVGSRISD